MSIILNKIFIFQQRLIHLRESTVVFSFAVVACEHGLLGEFWSSPRLRIVFNICFSSLTETQLFRLQTRIQ